MPALATPSTLSDASSLNAEHEEAQLQASGQPQRPQGSYAAVTVPRRRKRVANTAVPHQQVQVPDATSPPPQRRKREPNTVTSHQQVLEMDRSDAAIAGPQQRRKRESNPAPRQVIAEEGSDEATPSPQRRKRESNTAVTPPNKILAVVVPVYPGHVDQLFSAIEQRALSCPVGAMSNADLVLYYPDGGSDSSFRRVVYAVAGSIGRCFATIRTLRTRLGEEEEEVR